MSRYDSFATFYDRVIGDRADVASLLVRLIRLAAPHARDLLELGCGTGTMLQELSKHYNALGVDNSSAMLALARRKAPKAKVMLADIRSLALGRTFDAVVCPFDTMNHLVRISDWRKVLDTACSHLSPEGAFIFDVNTRAKMERYCDEPVEVTFHRSDFSTVQVTRRSASLYLVDLSLYKYVGGNRYVRRSMRLPERIIPAGEVTRLARGFFRHVTVLDPARRRPSHRSEELFFICSGRR